MTDPTWTPGSGVDPRPWFFALIGRQEGTPADDYKVVLRALADRGARINAKPHERPQADWPLGGISLNVADNGAGDPRGRVAFPTWEADPNGWYTHEVDIIVDRPGGGFNWGWNDHLGGPRIVLTATANTTAPVVVPPTTTGTSAPTTPEIALTHVRLLALETAIREGDAAIVAKLDEMKVAVIKAADEIRHALPNIGGLFGRRSPADGE